MDTQLKTLSLSYREYASVDALSPADQRLMQAAIDAAATAYAPYSHFSVGAALRLSDGSIVCGSNQENAAYPSGLCAERTALFAAGAQAPNTPVEALAIVARTPDGQLSEAAPCGACRQVMAETRQRSGCPLRILMYLSDGRIREVPDIAVLLPFAFQL